MSENEVRVRASMLRLTALSMEVRASHLRREASAMLLNEDAAAIPGHVTRVVASLHAITSRATKAGADRDALRQTAMELMASWQEEHGRQLHDNSLVSFHTYVELQSKVRYAYNTAMCAVLEHVAKEA